MHRGVDQRTPDAAAPKVGFHKESVEFACNDSSEAGDVTIELGDDHLAIGDLSVRQVDGVRIGGELIAVLAELERSSQLDGFQLRMFFGTSGAKYQRFTET